MKKIFASFYIIISVGIGCYLYQKYDTIQKIIQEQISSRGDISLPNNGNTLEPTKNTPPDPVIKDQTEYDKYIESLNGPFVRKFNPPAQPILNQSYSYQVRSNILNEYLKKNNFYFRNNSKLSEGYLHIRLAKPIGKYDIFLYFHDSLIQGAPVSGKIIKQNNLIVGDKSDQEFLFKLSKISIYKFYNGEQFDFNWLNGTLQDTDRVHFIGGYTTTSDGNYIQEITITGK